MFGKLILTNGVVSINLLKAPYLLCDWIPNTADLKNSGVWQDNPLIEGRRLSSHSRTNIIDSFILEVYGTNMDRIIVATQNIRRLMESARNYWETPWQDIPVWIEARGEKETNTRYAFVYDYRAPQDADPYHPPFINTTKMCIEDWSLVIEHGLWSGQAPMTADCVYLRNHHKAPGIMWLSPDATQATTRMSSSHFAFDNLPPNPFTAEIWVYGNLNFAASGYIFWKNQWYARVNAARQIECYANFGGVPATLITASSLPVNPQDWTHIAITCSGGGAPHFHVWVDGVDFGGAPVNGAGAYVVDVATDIHVASSSAAASELFVDRITAGSRMTWTRFSDNIRYAIPFVPIAYDKLPPFDANTICITNGGKTVAGEDGFGTGDITWNNTFAPYYTNDILNPILTLPEEGLLGIEKYYENESAFYCDFNHAYTINGDREGCSLDFAFYFDASTGLYGSNIIDNAPADMWPPTAPDLNDYFYYGCGYYQGAAIPQAIVLEVAANIGATIYTDIEYWNGAAWISVPEFWSTETAANKIIAVIVEPPTNIAPITVNGYYGYIFRIIPNTWTQASIISGPAMISAPGIEIANIGLSNSVYGDIPAIARIGQQTDKFSRDINTFHAYSRRAFSALRSLDRDIVTNNWFTPYINLTLNTGMPGKPKNQPGIAIVATRAAGAYSAVFDRTAPSNWCCQVAVAAASTEFITIAIAGYVMPAFQGKFWLLGRMIAQSGVKGNITVTPYITSPYYQQVSPAQQIPILNEIIEFGVIDIPAVGNGRYSEINFTLVFTATVAGPININLHDLILWPIDEWNAETELAPIASITTYIPGSTPTNPGSAANRFVLLDPIIAPKYSRTAVLGTVPAGATIPLDQTELNYVQGLPLSMSYNYPFLQANKAQKLYCLQAFRWNVVSLTDIIYCWPYTFACAWTVEKQERYESMRGNR